MSDWEEFCDDLGLNPHSDDDYDRFLGMLEGQPLSKERQYGSDSIPPISDQLAALRAKEARRQRFPTLSGTRAYWFPEADTAYPNWLPGTYPTTDEEELLSDRDFALEKKIFWSRLAMLVPIVVSAANRRHSALSYTSIGEGAFGFSKLSDAELADLQALLAEKLRRSKRWYSSQHHSRLKDIEAQDRKGYAECPWAKEQHEKYKQECKRSKFKIPNEVGFWTKALGLVRDEQARRVEISDDYE